MTKLEFSYWEELQEVEEAGGGELLAEDEEEEDMMMLYGIAGVGVLFLCICICVVCVIRKKRAMANKIGMELPPEPTDRQLFDQEAVAGRETNAHPTVDVQPPPEEAQ